MATSDPTPGQETPYPLDGSPYPLDGLPPFAVSYYGRQAAVLSLDPSEAGATGWEWLKDAFTSEFTANKPFRTILDVVRGRGCRTIVIEREYLDPDYRSEYSAFWSGRFVERPSRAERWHFFAAAFDADVLPYLPTGHGYLGYAVLRPAELGLVGRTVIAPPADLQTARLTSIVERPNLFGNPLEVVGVPFYQQDGEFLRCAHAAAWLCHYVAYTRGIVGRRLTAEIASMPSFAASKHRAQPSTGLTAEQLQAVFTRVGIPAFFLRISDLPPLPAEFPPLAGKRALGRASKAATRAYEIRKADERILRVVCKYLNSGFPITVLSENKNGAHAFTLVGWKPAPNRSATLIACDDQVGPYEVIDSPTDPSLGGHRGKWTALMIPLPARVSLTGEVAEARARLIVRTEPDLAETPTPSDFSDLAPLIRELHGSVSVRARLIEGRRYKAVAHRQGRDPEAVRVIRMATLPHWVWLVEFQDHAAREAGEADVVIAEIVFDSTSHDDAPSPLLFVTASSTIDLSEAEEEDEGEEDDEPDDSEPEANAEAGEPNTADRLDEIDEEFAENRFWYGATDGRRWQSLISDPRFNDAEYATEHPDSGRFPATSEPAPTEGGNSQTTPAP